jgi:hypothetical protein
MDPWTHSGIYSLTSLENVLDSLIGLPAKLLRNYYR